MLPSIGDTVVIVERKNEEGKTEVAFVRVFDTKGLPTPPPAI